MLDGWKTGYGEKNNQRREHPSLVPYDLLSDTEKEKCRKSVGRSFIFFKKNPHFAQYRETRIDGVLLRCRQCSSPVSLNVPCPPRSFSLPGSNRCSVCRNSLWLRRRSRHRTRFGTAAALRSLALDGKCHGPRDVRCGAVPLRGLWMATHRALAHQGPFGLEPGTEGEKKDAASTAAF